MSNPFDQFDQKPKAKAGSNPFDRFDSDAEPAADPAPGALPPAGDVPDYRHVFRNDVGMGERVMRALAGGYERVAGGTALLGGMPVAALIDAVRGDDAATNYVGRAVDENFNRARELAPNARTEQVGLTDNLTHGVVSMVPDLAFMALTGGAPRVAAPLIEQGVARQVAGAVERAAIESTRATAVPSTIYGVERARDVIDRGGSVGEAAVAGTSSGVGSLLTNLLPASASGSLVTRMLQGAPANVAADRLQGVIDNAAVDDRLGLDQQRTLEDDLISALIGAPMAGVMGERGHRPGSFGAENAGGDAAPNAASEPQPPNPAQAAPAPGAETASPVPASVPRQAGPEPAAQTITPMLVRAANYRATNADPGRPDAAPLSREDAVFVLETLLDRAQKGKLTPEAFAQSEYGALLGTSEIMPINEALRADPVGTITALLDGMNEAPARPVAPAPDAPRAPVEPQGDTPPPDRLAPADGEFKVAVKGGDITLRDAAVPEMAALQGEGGWTREVKAFDADGNEIGSLLYTNDGTPPTVEVVESRRREGVATAMLALAERQGGSLGDAATGRTDAGVTSRRSDDGQAFRAGTDTSRATLVPVNAPDAAAVRAADAPAPDAAVPTFPASPAPASRAGLADPPVAGRAGDARDGVASADGATAGREPRVIRTEGRSPEMPPPEGDPLDVRSEIGWDQRGGQLQRAAPDPSTLNDDERAGLVDAPRGEVIGRTTWVGKMAPDGSESTLWRNRPVKLTEAEANRALDKYEAGERLTKREQVFVDYAREVSREYEQMRRDEIERERGEQDVAARSEREQVAAETNAGAIEAAAEAGVKPADDRPAPALARTTALKNEVTDAEREALGGDPIERGGNPGWQDMLDSAARAEPDAAARVAARILDGGPIERDDQPLLLRHKITLANARDKAAERATDANLSDAERADAVAEWERLERETLHVQMAASVVGTELGLQLNFRKAFIDQDYSLQHMEQVMRVVTGEPVTPAMSKRLKEISDKYAAAVAEIDRIGKALQDAEDRAEGLLVLAEMAKNAPRASRPRRAPGGGIDRLRERAEAARKRIEARAGINKPGKQAGALDVALLADYVDIGVYEFARGAQRIKEWAAAMGESLGDRFRSLGADVQRQIFNRARAQHAAEGEPAASRTPADVLAAIKGEPTHGDVYALGLAHVREGLVTGMPREQALDTLLARIADDLKARAPDIDAREVGRLLSDYGRATFPTPDADRKLLRDLRAMARLDESIRRAQEGLAPLKSGPQRDKAVGEVRARQQKLNELLKAQEQASRASPERLAAWQDVRRQHLLNQIEDLQRQIAGGAKDERSPTPALDAQNTQLAERRDDLRRELDALERTRNPERVAAREQARIAKYIENELAKVRKRIATKDYAPRERVPRALVGENATQFKALIDARKEFDRLRFNEKMKQRTAAEKAYGLATDTLNLGRATLLSLDAGAFMLQGGLYLGAHPVKAMAGLKKSLRVWWFDRGVKDAEYAQEIKNSPRYALYQRHKLALVGDAAYTPANQDEIYAARWIDWIAPEEMSERPAVRGARNLATGLLRTSQSSYNALINKVRTDWFDTIYDSLDSKFGGLTREQGDAIARFVNVMTGRSSNKQVQQAAGLMQWVFLAWHWTASRAQILVGAPVWMAPKGMKGAFFKEYARAYGGLAAVNMLLALGAMAYNRANGEDEDDKPFYHLDPRVGYVFKYRYGNTWVGFDPGIGPMATFVSRLVTGETVRENKKTGEWEAMPLSEANTLSGAAEWFDDDSWLTESERRVMPYDSTANLMFKFWHGRSNPWLGYVGSWRSGKNPAGQDFHATRDAASLVIPINLQDPSGPFKEFGPVAGSAVSFFRFLGGKSSYYDPDVPYGERPPLPWETPSPLPWENPGTRSDPR